MRDIELAKWVEKIRTDPLYFFEECLFVQDKESGSLVPFKLNNEQLYVLERHIWPKWVANQPVRIIVLKARQLGISTLIEAFIYWMATTRPNTNAMVLAHHDDATKNILKMSSGFAMKDHRHVLGVMPMIANVNKDELLFDNADWRDRVRHPGLNSRILVATAGNKMSGHSYTLQALHASEVALWPNPDVFTGILPALADTPQSFGALESTAHGASGPFYEKWQQAVRGKNEWDPIFLSWKNRREYRVKLTPKRKEKYELTAEEEKIVAEHAIDFEQVEWRRRRVEAFRGMKRMAEDVFAEQFPITPEEAFIATGKNYFDMVSLLHAERKARDARFDLGLLVGPPLAKLTRSTPDPKWSPSKAGNIKVWAHPVNGEDYVVGADVAAGIKGGDYSVAYVMHRLTQEVVACYRASVDTDTYARDLINLGWYYNEAFLAPESNAIGLAVSRAVSRLYRRVCYKVKLSDGEPGDMDEMHPGWYTDRVNRPHMVAHLRQHLKDGTVTIQDEVFFEEAQDFTVPSGLDGRMKEGEPRGTSGSKDDCVMALCITLWVNDPRIAGPIRKPKPKKRIPANWREEAMMRDIETEKTSEKRVVYDEHLGRMEI